VRRGALALSIITLLATIGCYDWSDYASGRFGSAGLDAIDRSLVGGFRQQGSGSFKPKRPARRQIA
jgi:hypothetical protein